MSVIDEVKERTDIVDLVSSYLPLQKAGRNFKALCPFHKEKTPSFVVFPDGQRWHCFGACASGGDVFTFVMKIENMEFAEALRFLARRAGISLAPRTEAQLEEDKRRRLLLTINATAAQYFHHLLLRSPEGERARRYLAQRAIEPASIEAFQLGYSLPDWEALKGHLVGKGYGEGDVFAAGLSIEREGGGYYDRFRGRLIIPIRNIKGEVIGFGARALDDSDPKYLNSPETPLFSKGSLLYGIDLAKRAIREEDQAVIVEGYFDVITAYQKGFPNVVASMGTALTESQMRSLKRLTKRFILALDADKAGEVATQRGLEVAKEVLRDVVVPVPLGKNLIHYESRLGADIRIGILPRGNDPDDVMREDAERWAQLIAEALPIVDYYFSLVAERLDLRSAKGKSAAARELLPIIEELSDEVGKAHYLQKLARLIKVDERRLLIGARAQKFPEAQRGRNGPLSSSPGFLLGVEKRLLLLLLEEPQRIGMVDEELTHLEAHPLEPEDFADVENREIFAALGRSWPELTGEKGWDIDRFGAHLDEPLQDRFAYLMEWKGRMSMLEEKEGEGMLCALRLREYRIGREIETLQFLTQDAEEEGDQESLRGLATVISERKDEVGRIKKARYERSCGRRGKKEKLWEGSWLLEG